MDLIQAIDKFIAEANNFESVQVEYKIPHYYGGAPYTKTYVPRFIAEVNWTCNLDHMIDKWHEVCNRTDDPSAYFIRYYCQLDGQNKRLMLQWIIDHSEHNYI